MSMFKQRWFLALVALALLVSVLPAGQPAVAQTDSRTFPETGKTVSGKFLDYWNAHGGLAQQGCPISDEMQDVVDYRRQDLHRAVFRARRVRAPPGERRHALRGAAGALLGVFDYTEQLSGSAARPIRQASTDNADHVRGDRQDPRRQVPRLLGEPRRAGPAGLPDHQRVPGEERARRQDLHRAVFRARRVRAAPGEPAPLSTCCCPSLAPIQTRPRPTCPSPTGPAPRSR